MPHLKIKTYQTQDHRWLGSLHATGSAQHEVLDASKFTAGIVDGVLQSGMPLAKVGGLCVPYDASASDGSEKLLGFLLTAQKTTGDTQFAVPVVWHGSIRTEFLPVPFVAPANPGLFNFKN